MSTTTVDIAVLGAGVVGCVIARELLDRSPNASVMVLDRDLIASGASRRSAGLHFPRGATERVRRMSAHSQDYYAKLLATEPGLPIRPLPMRLVTAEAGEAALREVYLDSSRLRRAVPPPDGLIRIPEDCTVWEGDGCQYADVPALAHLLSHRLRHRVRFREGVRVTGVRPEEKAVALTLGTGDTVTAGRAVLAPGPWIAALAWRELLAPLNLRVKKVVAMHVDAQPEVNDPLIVFHDEDAFLLPLHERRHWLFSYTCREWDVTPDTVADGVSSRDLREAREVLARYAPALVGRCESGRVFCDAYSPIREPVVTPLDDHGRLVFAGAANGSGYRLAPAIAAEAADVLQLTDHAERGQR